MDKSDMFFVQVNVTIEYSRKVALMDGPTSFPAISDLDSRLMDFGSVFLLSASKSDILDASLTCGSGDQPLGMNVAIMVVCRGLATVVRHKEFEERSNFYDSLLSAESRAQKEKKGLHSGKATPAIHINDLSVQVKVFY
jgi:staphylococcal nuclease domain-containing protein 1